MAAELMIRPSLGDNKIVADLLAPSSVTRLGARRRPIDRLIVDAHVARARPDFADVAQGAGIPFMVDPLTPLLQGELRKDDQWAKLPFGTPDRVTPEGFQDVGRRRDFVGEVVGFQLDQGASVVIPPYLYAATPDDPAFTVSLDFLRLTVEVLEQRGVRLPLMPVLCAQLRGFGSDRTWKLGIDRFALTARDHGALTMGFCLSPTGSTNDSYDKVFRLFEVGRRLKKHNIRVMPWRQGIYGPGLVAAGLDGYESGIGTREQCNIAGLIANRKPKKSGEKKSGGSSAGVFLEPLGRSVPTKVAQALLGHLSMRAKVMCDDERCCPQGPASTLDHRREHAVRSRARLLAKLDELPSSNWRLHKIERAAQQASVLVEQSNQVLKESGLRHRLHREGLEALRKVAEHLREESKGSEAAG